jgi:TPR repeat protein
MPDNATAHYNLGLLYFDKKNYSKAKVHAEKAYALNFPLPGLRNRLKKVGKWSD